jgi:hypothetical protein
MKTRTILLNLTILFAAALMVRAGVQPRAHYSLKGAGGIRDTAAPGVWRSLAPGGPELARQGSPKVMSNGPECRRQEYDSCIKFEAPDQCYSVGKNLVVRKKLTVPLYYTGLTATARIREQEGEPATFKLDRAFNVRLPVEIPANGYRWFVIE